VATLRSTAAILWNNNMHLKKVLLHTAFPETLMEFYSLILQLPVQIIDENEIKVNIGASVLVFTKADNAEPFYHFAINIPANKIEEAKAWLTDKVELLWMGDYKSDIADFRNWHAKSVYFYDPAGNILELISRFDLHNESSSESFSSKQFISISEVGLVFKPHEFEQKNSELLTSYSLSYFSKQPPLPQFRAIGDDDGLFVVVPDKRNWYPTNKPAGIFPMNVEFENEGKNFNMDA
jgi:hypothetical protein